MKINSELLNILIWVICCIIPLSLFMVAISFVVVRNIKARWKYAKEITENLNDPIYTEKLLPVPRRYLPIYIVVSLITMGSLICVMLVVFAYYLDFPIVNNISSETLGIVGGGVLLIVLLVTLVMISITKIHNQRN